MEQRVGVLPRVEQDLAHPPRSEELVKSRVEGALLHDRDVESVGGAVADADSEDASSARGAAQIHALEVYGDLRFFQQCSRNPPARAGLVDEHHLAPTVDIHDGHSRASHE
eukprot:CAMPEP_0176100984 /NCGR_PEP_ID=MMETSP0120_2-20121206/50651_1 /TAXON_ID=160619 /ORGANISM="Kryptoperidinium foliaceum, Strain CCMP 1326" /LENGTH=110 /DNA_ID=CAMNT_0017435035 /DNA_START=500 /DNA_END=832 /DNA_ORIENTATION=-